MSNFYDMIAQDIQDEAKDNNKYLELAKIAPTEKARKILTDIAAEEKLHHKYLSEILSERACYPEVESQKDNSTSHKPLSKDYEIDYPTDIENVGLDPDELDE